MVQVLVRREGPAWAVLVDGEVESRHVELGAANARKVQLREELEAATVTRVPVDQLLSGGAKFVAAAIATGDWDDVLEGIEEKDDRKTVQAAVKARREVLADGDA